MMSQSKVKFPKKKFLPLFDYQYVRNSKKKIEKDMCYASNDETIFKTVCFPMWGQRSKCM